MGGRVGQLRLGPWLAYTLVLPQAGPAPTHTHTSVAFIYFIPLVQPLPWGRAGRWACIK